MVKDVGRLYRVKGIARRSTAMATGASLSTMVLRGIILMTSQLKERYE
jgi:hypothetical protein